MFDSIGWGEIIVLALAALFIFGPERLPHLAKDAADGLKKVRTAVTGVRAQMDDALGDDLAHLRNVDLRQYHPKTFIRTQLLGDDDEGPVLRRGVGATSLTKAAPTKPTSAGGPTTVTAPVRDRAVPPPFDPDAT